MKENIVKNGLWHSKLLTQQPINLAVSIVQLQVLLNFPKSLGFTGVFNTYADIADKAKDSIIYEQVVHAHSNRMMTCDQVVKCLIIYEGKLVLPTDDFETLSYEQVKTLIKFFLSESIRKKYYFEFHY